MIDYKDLMICEDILTIYNKDTILINIDDTNNFFKNTVTYHDISMQQTV